MKTIRSFAVIGAFLAIGSMASASALQTTMPCGKASTVGLLESTGPAVASTFKAPVLSVPGSSTPVRK